MPRGRRSADPLEERLAALRALRDEGASPRAIEALRAALGDRSPRLVARAAEIAGELELAEPDAPLAEAFARCLVDPLARDKGCLAKNAVAEALVRLGAARPEVFLAGARHVQPEPVWGNPPTVDTAASLRGACATGLVRSAHPEAWSVVADLLADPEPAARAGAAEAAGHGAALVAEPLLRLRVLAGDPEPNVVGACFASLLRVAPRSSFALVAARLDAPEPAVREAAAFALGDSQLPDALPALRAWMERRTDRGTERTALLAIALLRQDAALDDLLARVATAPAGTARVALEAVSPQCSRPAVRARVEEAVRRRADRALDAELVGRLAADRREEA